MGWEAWLTIVTTILVFLAMVRDWAPPDVLFIVTAAFLAGVGIISPEDAVAGFSNPGMLTVAAMFVVAAGLRETGFLEYLGQRVLGGVATEGGALRRLSKVVIPFSAFLNNTPLVAMFMPMVIEWCRRHRISPSRLLIPLSYLAILGGTCTLIGTSTNLVVHGLMVQKYEERARDASGAESAEEARRREGLRGLGLFEISMLGLPYALVGVFYLRWVGIHLLPERKEFLEQMSESQREYLVEMLVEPGCHLAGDTVQSAGLRQLPGLFLIEIDRNGQVIGPVSPEEVIHAGDRLVFTGVVRSIIELERINGLVPTADPAYQVTASRQRNRQLCEAVISESSPLVGKTVREADFRATYNAAVLAVHRNGKRVTNKVGDILLQPGDTLLLQTRPHFARAHRNSTDFYLTSNVEDWRPLRRDRAGIAMALFLALLVLMMMGLMPIVIAAMLAAGFMVLTGCLSAGDARKSIDWQVLMTIAASFALGTALEKSGAVTAIVKTVFEYIQPWGPLAALACIYIIGSILTEMITNNAAAVLLFPFCLQTAELCNASPRPFLIALIFAASASFISPIGYQTNMMVYGPGGYRFSDFMRIGMPLHIVLWVIAITLIPVLWPF